MEKNGCVNEKTLVETIAKSWLRQCEPLVEITRNSWLRQQEALFEATT